MRRLIVLLLMIFVPAAMAAPYGHRGDAGRMSGGEFSSKSLLGHQGRAPRVGNQQAAAQVKHAYSNRKILSLELMNNAKGPPLYRVKTLSPNGVVKYVYVDAISGDVFE